MSERLKYTREQVRAIVRQALAVYEEKRRWEGAAALDSAMDVANALIDQATFVKQESRWTWSRCIPGCFAKIFHAPGQVPTHCPDCGRPQRGRAG